MSLSGRKVLFRVDANTSIGSGHFMRCLALAQALLDRGASVVWATASLVDHLGGHLTDEGIELARLHATPGSADDLTETLLLLQHQRADLCVLDGYVFGTEFRQRLCRSRAQLLVIDDEGFAQSLPGSVILNQNLHASMDLYGGSQQEARVLLGVDYALLRRQIRAATPRLPEDRARGLALLVLTGGSDPHGLSYRLLSALEHAQLGLDVRCVIGFRHSTARYPELLRCAERIGGGIIENVAQMHLLIDAADLAVSTAGSTVWELMRFGVPSLLVSIAENQQPIGQAAMRAGAALFLGSHERLSPNAVVDSLRDLAGDAERRCTMARAGMATVDGDGTLRVLDTLAESLDG